VKLALLLVLAMSACAGRHVWVDDGFIAPQLYQWCSRHEKYHPVNKVHGRDSKELTSGKMLKM